MNDKNFVKIIKGNCLKGIKKIKDASVHLTITSPPYNIKLESKTEGVKNYFDNVDEKEYRSNIGNLMRDLSRITVQDGSIWINLKNRWMDCENNVVSSMDGSLEPPWWILEYTREILYLKNLIIWNFDTANDTQGNKFSPRYEYFFWFVKHPKEYKFYMDRIRVRPRTSDKRNNPIGANPTDVWYFPIVKGNSSERGIHPAQFPEEMIERIVSSCSDRGDTVFDPFLGSGTTVSVSVIKGRNCIGFEIDPDYIGHAKERIQNLVKSSFISCDLQYVEMPTS